MPRLNPTCPAIPRSRLAQWRADAAPDPSALEHLGAVRGDGRRLVVIGQDAATRRASVAHWIGTGAFGGVLAVTAGTATGVNAAAGVLLHATLSQLRSALHEPQGVPLGEQELVEALPGWLARAGAGPGAVIIIDGVDALEGWPADSLPAHLPARVTMVLGVSSGRAAEAVRARGWEAVQCAGPRRAGEADTPPALIHALQAVPEGIEDALVEALDPDGACRRDWRPDLRRSPGGLRLAGAQGPGEPLDEGGGAIRAAALTAPLTLTTTELLTATGFTRDAESLLASPELLATGDHATVILAALWRSTPLPELGLRRLADGLPTGAHEAERRFRLMALATLLEQPEIADELHQGLLAVADDLPKTTASEVLRREAQGALDQGDSERAAGLFRQAAARADAGGARARRQSAEHGLATALETSGDLAGAESLYQQALDRATQRHGPHAPGILATLMNLAAVQRAANRLEPAREHFSRALGIAERALGAEHPTTIGLHDSLGGLLYGGGDPDSAEHHYREAAARAERAFGPGHTASAACWHNLGTLLDARARYREAEVWLRQALAVRRHHHGDHHSDTASTLHNLAGVLDVTGRGREAERAYRDALSAWQALVGEDHPATATSRNNLADLLRERGDHDEAETLYRRNIRTWTDLYGDRHPNTLMTAAELGGLLSETGRHGEAETLLRRAVDGLGEQLGPTAGLTVDAVLRLATLWRSTSRPRDALELMNRTLSHGDGQVASLSPHLQRLRKHRDALRGGLQ